MKGRDENVVVSIPDMFLSQLLDDIPMMESVMFDLLACNEPILAASVLEF